MGYLVIHTRSAVPAYVQILDQIRERVRDGTLCPGGALPSVRQLAADLALNPNTVAKAYMLLEREGIIQTVRRRGAFVAQAAREKALHAADRRLDDALERVLEEADRLGMRQEQLLEAIQRRLRRDDSRREPPGGAKS